MATVHVALDQSETKLENKPVLTPPASEEADKINDSGSDLSDLDQEVEDEGEIVPDHYYDGGKVPVFKPTMDQFRSFKKFVDKIDKYGMKSGIVKVIPPPEWRNALPALDEQIKSIKVKNPITQEFHGTHGTYTQANIEKQRSYNLPQWKAVSEESNHQPPARRGERRRNQEKVTRVGARGSTSTRVRGPAVTLPNGKKRAPGRPRVRTGPVTVHKHEEDGEEECKPSSNVPPTPTSPPAKTVKPKKERMSEDEEVTTPKTKGRQPKSVSSRRQHNRRDQADVIDEEAFKGFDYRVSNQDEWTTERCQELETAYWKGLTFNNPMYGADMPGSLFDDSTKNWNVAKLENLLDVLGQKVPGVNTAYLYLGMWKASFAWHLEDVDLYSINYIHFGAPKQWYSISQEDARKFEAAMRNVWPNDAKNCDQFLRHKTYLISPQLLQSQYNIKVNRLVHNEGEFVITFPYGYHSGYNLGYNCAESVNFATESWLDFGRVAKKCNCEADSVWVDVGDIERKLRGEQTPEYYEETDDEEDEEDEEEEGPTDLPTPPGSDKGKPKPRSHKRKRDPADGGAKPAIKKLRIKLKTTTKEPCTLCPNDPPFEDLLPTENGQKVHRRCALYTPETYIAEVKGVETVCDVTRIDKARLELKCVYCRNKSGAVFQCSAKKCTRPYHATCAAAAGVQVDIGIVPVFGEDGTEYTDMGIDFRCRFHRTKRGKTVDGAALEETALIKRHAAKLTKGEVVQLQYYQGEIFAGVILENRKSEQMLHVEVLPKGDKVEVEYKWLLVFDPVNSQLPVPSVNAKALPAHLARKSQTTAEHPTDSTPKADEPFSDPKGPYIWAEFNTAKIGYNKAQVDIDFSTPQKIWFYLGKTSTEAKAQYTSDPSSRQNDPSGNFLESVRVATTVASVLPPARKSFPASYPSGVNINAANAARVKSHMQPQPQKIQAKPAPNLLVHSRPYAGKYAIKDLPPPEYKNKTGYHVDPLALDKQRAFQQSAGTQVPERLQGHQTSTQPIAPMASMAGSLQSPSMHPQGQDTDENQRLSSMSRAPVANMMGAPLANMASSGNSAGRNPFSRPPPPIQRRTLSVNATPSPMRKRSNTLETIARYPYLQAAQQARPPVYQSPYAAEGGFTLAWLPNPPTADPVRPRSKGLSQDFLMHQSPRQQEQVKTHIRQISAERLLNQEQRRQEQQRRLSHERATMPPPQISPHQPYFPQLLNPMPMHSFHKQENPLPHELSNHSSNYKHQPDYHYSQPAISQSDHHDPHLSRYRSYPHNESHLSPSTSTPFDIYEPTPQYQSPQDFQLQTQHEPVSKPQYQTSQFSTSPEGHQHLHSNGYEHFPKFDPHAHGASAIGHGHELGSHHHHHHQSQIGPGQMMPAISPDVGGVGDMKASSPLRNGFGAGGEMLPMMKDQF